MYVASDIAHDVGFSHDVYGDEKLRNLNDVFVEEGAHIAKVYMYMYVTRGLRGAVLL